jgi:hypothetical protein
MQGIKNYIQNLKGAMMENEKKDPNLVLAGLKFSTSEIGEASSKEKNTNLAIIMIVISIVIDVAIAYFKGNPGNSGLARMGLTGFNAAIAELGSVLIGTFLSAFIMVYVLRIFKAKATYSGVLRVYGAAIIWTILGSIIGLLLPPNLAMAGVLFWLAYNFAVMFGLTGYTKIKLWQSFVSIVLTFIVVFIVIILYGMVVGVVF